MGSCERRLRSNGFLPAPAGLPCRLPRRRRPLPPAPLPRRAQARRRRRPPPHHHPSPPHPRPSPPHPRPSPVPPPRLPVRAHRPPRAAPTAAASPPGCSQPGPCHRPGGCSRPLPPKSVSAKHPTCILLLTESLAMPVACCACLLAERVLGQSPLSVASSPAASGFPGVLTCQPRSPTRPACSCAWLGRSALHGEVQRAPKMAQACGATRCLALPMLLGPPDLASPTASNSLLDVCAGL